MLVDYAEDLNGDERRQRDKRHAAERLRHDRRRIDHIARTDRHRKHKRRHHCPARNAARIERDAREERRREKCQDERNDIAGDQDPHDIDPRQDPRHGQTEGDTDADAQPLHHGRGSDRPGAHALDLLVEDMDGRFRRHDEISDDHSDGNEQPAAPQLREALADEPADGHKADVCTRQKERKAKKRIDKPDDDAHDLPFAKNAGHDLKEDEERQNGRDRDGNFNGIIPESVQILKKHAARIGDRRQAIHRIFHVVDIEDDPERQHSNDGSYA